MYNLEAIALNAANRARQRSPLFNRNLFWPRRQLDTAFFQTLEKLRRILPKVGTDLFPTLSKCQFDELLKTLVILTRR